MLAQNQKRLEHAAFQRLPACLKELLVGITGKLGSRPVRAVVILRPASAGAGLWRQHRDSELSGKVATRDSGMMRLQYQTFPGSISWLLAVDACSEQLQLPVVRAAAWGLVRYLWGPRGVYVS